MGSETYRMELDEPLFEVECAERDGPVVRTVKMVSLTPEKLRELYLKLEQYPGLFSDYTRGDYEAFLNHFIAQRPDGSVIALGLIFEVDDVGIVYLTNISPGFQAQAHLAFWDRKLKGRDKLVKKLLDFGFNFLKLHRIYVEIPMYAVPVMPWLEKKLGFVNEGRLREATIYFGQWYDVNLYSMLAGELNHGNEDQEHPEAEPSDPTVAGHTEDAPG